MLALALLLPLSAHAAPPADPDWHLAIVAAVDDDEGTVAGTAAVTVRNPTPRPLATVRFFLVPEHYAERPILDDILWERVYPNLWEPASMTVGFVRALHDDGGSDALSWRRLPEGPPIIEVSLDTPLLPGDSTTVELAFLTRLPRKFGTLGSIRGRLSASGGWHPLPVALAADGTWLDDAPPPMAEVDVVLRSPASRTLMLGDRVAVPEGDERLGHAFVPAARPLGGVSDTRVDGEQRETTWRGRARFLGLSLLRGARQRDIPLDDGTTLTWIGRPLTRAQLRWLRRAAEATREAQGELGLAASPRDVLLVEARMRRRLVELGDGVIYVSDRYLEADLPFWRYHDVHLARAIIALDIEPTVLAAEPPRYAPFALDALSWELVSDYLETRWRNHVGLRNLLQRFSFFPQVETLLETPAFPFADQIFDNPWIVDPLKADIRRFNRPLRTGRTLSLRLDDHVGAASKRQAMLRYLRGETTQPLFALLEESSGKPVLALTEGWLGSVPRVDFQLEDVTRERTDDGLHLTTVTARRVELEGSAPHEIVEVRLSPGLGRKRGRITLRWEGAEEVARWEVVSKRRLSIVEIDPQRRIIELDENGLNLRQDNRRPQSLRVSGFGYAGLSITGQGFEAYGLLNFRPRHNARHQVNLRAFTNEQSVAGGGVTYAHYFGPPRWGINLRHRVVFTLDVAYLNTNFRPTDAPLLTEVTAGYVYETRSNSFMPTQGERIEVFASVGRDFSLKNEGVRNIAESGFLGLDARAVRLFKLHPFHVLAVRAKAGFVLGDVQHALLTLGGNQDLRGIPEREILSPARVMGAVEWRHLFFKDADIAIPFQRVRGLQGHLFLEGAVAAKSLDAPPGVDDLHYSVGYGFRWFVDWLGVLPGTWGMDIAFTPGVTPGRWPRGFDPREWPEVPFQIYFAGSQSF